jgi:hypothetical protein
LIAAVIIQKVLAYVFVPVGEIPYISGITHQKESLPISVSVVSSPGGSTTELPENLENLKLILC